MAARTLTILRSSRRCRPWLKPVTGISLASSHSPLRQLPRARSQLARLMLDFRRALPDDEASGFLVCDSGATRADGHRQRGLIGFRWSFTAARTSDDLAASCPTLSNADVPEMVVEPDKSAASEAPQAANIPNLRSLARSERFELPTLRFEV
jgi:hypothetical protein